MELDIRETGIGDPAVRTLVASMAAEVAERHASAGGDLAGDAARPLEQALEPGSVLLIAYLNGEPVGVGALREVAAGIGEIKRMYVDPGLRGSGIGGRLLEELESRARQRGYVSVRLDTHDRLTEANRLYERAGYREIPDYNANPSANRWLEKPLA